MLQTLFKMSPTNLCKNAPNEKLQRSPGEATRDNPGIGEKHLVSKAHPCRQSQEISTMELVQALGDGVTDLSGLVSDAAIPDFSLTPWGPHIEVSPGRLIWIFS